MVTAVGFGHEEDSYAPTIKKKLSCYSCLICYTLVGIMYFSGQCRCTWSWVPISLVTPGFQEVYLIEYQYYTGLRIHTGGQMWSLMG